VLSKHLLALQNDFKLVRREVPFGQSPCRSKKGAYVLADNLLAFWFSLVRERRALVSKEVGMRGELIDMFRWSPKEDTILPADPLEIAQKSYRLQTVAALKGWSVDALAAELAGRAKYLSDIVRSGAYKYADVSAAIQRFYKEKYGV
jgi:hypothetical protein